MNEPTSVPAPLAILAEVSSDAGRDPRGGQLLLLWRDLDVPRRPGPFPLGVSGNPAGKPKGARNRPGKALDALLRKTAAPPPGMHSDCRSGRR